MKLLVTMCTVAVLSCSAGALDVTQKKSQEPANTSAKQGAKQEQPSAAEKKPAEAAMPDKPKPSAEMKKLTHLLGGRWQVDEKYEITPFTPQGGEGKGTNIVHRGPGGLSVLTNYTSTGTLGEYHGSGIMTWSPDDSTYKQFWVDNGAPGGSLWTGKWDGDSVVFTSTQKMGDQTIHWRETYSGFTSDTFTIAFDMGPTESDLKRCMTFKFTRMARQAAGEHRHGMGMHGRPNYDPWGSPRAGAAGDGRSVAALR
jgi:hypothetical protein